MINWKHKINKTPSSVHLLHDTKFKKTLFLNKQQVQFFCCYNAHKITSAFRNYDTSAHIVYKHYSNKK